MSDETPKPGPAEAIKNLPGMKAAKDHPLVFVLAILFILTNTATVVKWLVPDLKETFVTHEQFEPVREDIQEIKADLKELKKIANARKTEG